MKACCKRPDEGGHKKVWQCSWPQILPMMLVLSPVQQRDCVAPLAISTEAGNGKQFWHWQPGVLPFSNTFDVHTWSFGCCCWGPSVGMASCLIKWWYASFTGTWIRCQTKRVWFYFYYSEFKAHANANPHFNTIVVPVKPSFFSQCLPGFYHVLRNLTKSSRNCHCWFHTNKGTVCRSLVRGVNANSRGGRMSFLYT